MLKIDLDKKNGFAVLEPQGALSRDDFARAAETIDPFIEQSGSLKGILIFTESFPGWESIGAFVQHFKFVKNHHEQIAKVALVTDSNIASVAESFAQHFVAAQIKHFPFGQRESAEHWIING